MTQEAAIAGRNLETMTVLEDETYDCNVQIAAETDDATLLAELEREFDFEDTSETGAQVYFLHNNDLYSVVQDPVTGEKRLAANSQFFQGDLLISHLEAMQAISSGMLEHKLNPVMFSDDETASVYSHMVYERLDERHVRVSNHTEVVDKHSPLKDEPSAPVDSLLGPDVSPGFTPVEPGSDVESLIALDGRAEITTHEIPPKPKTTRKAQPRLHWWEDVGPKPQASEVNWWVIDKPKPPKPAVAQGEGEHADEPGDEELRETSAEEAAAYADDLLDTEQVVAEEAAHEDVEAQAKMFVPASVPAPPNSGVAPGSGAEASGPSGGGIEQAAPVPEADDRDTVEGTQATGPQAKAASGPQPVALPVPLRMDHGVVTARNVDHVAAPTMIEPAPTIRADVAPVEHRIDHSPQMAATPQLGRVESGSFDETPAETSAKAERLQVEELDTPAAKVELPDVLDASALHVTPTVFQAQEQPPIARQAEELPVKPINHRGEVVKVLAERKPVDSPDESITRFEQQPVARGLSAARPDGVARHISGTVRVEAVPAADNAETRDASVVTYAQLSKNPSIAEIADTPEEQMFDYTLADPVVDLDRISERAVGRRQVPAAATREAAPGLPLVPDTTDSRLDQPDMITKAGPQVADLGVPTEPARMPELFTEPLGACGSISDASPDHGQAVMEGSETITITFEALDDCPHTPKHRRKVRTTTV